MTDFDSVVLGDDEILVLRPKHPMTPEQLDNLNANLSATLHGRVIVVDPRCDVLVVKQF